jgi:hypothetical protein
VFARRLKTEECDCVTAVRTQNTVLWPKTMTPFGYIGLLPFFLAPSLKKIELIGYIGLADKKEAAQQTKHKTDIYLFIYSQLFKDICLISNFTNLYKTAIWYGVCVQPPTTVRSVFSKNRKFLYELGWK